MFSSSFNFVFDPAFGLYLPPAQVHQFDTAEIQELEDLLKNASFDQAEQLARKLQNKTPQDTPQAATAAHLLARALFANAKFAESTLFKDLAQEIHKILRIPLDTESMLLDILGIQLFEQAEKYDDAICLADKLIDQCIAPHLAPHLHLPIVLKCLILIKQKKIAEVGNILRTFLPVMRGNKSPLLGDELRRLWSAVAEAGRSDVSDIVRIILSHEVEELVNEEESSNFESWVPDKWSTDALSNFLQLAENNSMATFQDCQKEFRTLRSIEARLRLTSLKSKEIMLHTAHLRLGDDLTFNNIEPEDWLETFFVMRSHSAFLGAIRLATSAQYAETNMVLRGALEHAMYCFVVSDNPKLRRVWFDKYKDNDSADKFKRSFSIANIAIQMRRVDTDLDAECARLYEQLIDLGGHPNERTFSKLGKKEVTSDQLAVHVATLQPALIGALLDTVIDVGALMLELFAKAMPSCTAAPPLLLVDHAETAERAYRRWLNRGGEDGGDLLDWFRAESEVRLSM